ncbi:MAG: helix-turn-helix transcriptional regulator [Firmicutes bacterium]|jgi:DNA-binding PadR family transcriptional regulator|nr:helix-turn-helix transcriptional regulator [Bacillota bacterium]
MDRFMEPCILLLVAREPSHGYELLERLEEFGFCRDDVDTATLYRTLRRLEEEGAVVSEWEAGEQGPARRKYTMTDEGRELLREWASIARERVRRLGLFLKGYEGSVEAEAEGE